jgi:hypothetical protein
LKFVVYGPASTNFFFDVRLDRLCCRQIGITSFDNFFEPAHIASSWRCRNPLTRTLPLDGTR